MNRNFARRSAVTDYHKLQQFAAIVAIAAIVADCRDCNKLSQITADCRDCNKLSLIDGTGVNSKIPRCI